MYDSKFADLAVYNSWLFKKRAGVHQYVPSYFHISVKITSASWITLYVSRTFCWTISWPIFCFVGSSHVQVYSVIPVEKHWFKWVCTQPTSSVVEVKVYVTFSRVHLFIQYDSSEPRWCQLPFSQTTEEKLWGRTFPTWRLSFMEPQGLDFGWWL